jgi:hypothetical protein
MKKQHPGLGRGALLFGIFKFGAKSKNGTKAKKLAENSIY